MKIMQNKQDKNIVATVIGGDEFALCKEDEELTSAAVKKMIDQLAKLSKYEDKVKAAKEELGKPAVAKKKAVVKKPVMKTEAEPIASLRNPVDHEVPAIPESSGYAGW